MTRYLVRRLGVGALTLLLVTFVVYGLIRNIPGTPLTTDPAMADPAIDLSPEEVARLEKMYGLDKPWYVAYWHWLGRLAVLDLGRSIPNNHRPVFELIGERVPATLLLSVTSLVLAYGLSIPLGLWSTARNGKPDERVVSTFLYMLYSLPSFVAALFLQTLLAVKLGWLPLFGIRSDDFADLSLMAKAWDLTSHAIMPVMCFTYGSLAYYSRFIRANMQEAIRQDYVRTARAKGLSEHAVVVRHAFRNTLIPLVTLVGLTLPSLLSGSIILEQIFTWPGMGRLYFEAIGKRDYDTVMGLTLVFSVLTLLGQLLADLLYAVVDPRVRNE